LLGQDSITDVEANLNNLRKDSFFMKFYMNLYRKVVITICIIITVILTIIMCIQNPFIKTFVTNNYPTETDYSLWKQYAVEVSKSLDPEIITDEEVEISREIVNDRVIVDVYSIKYGIILRGVYPILFNIQNDNKMELQIDYENEKYETYYYSNLFSTGKGLYKGLTFILEVIFYIGGSAIITGFGIFSPLEFIYIQIEKKKNRTDEEVSL